MAQPAGIGVVKGSEIGNAIFQHRRTLDAEAEGETLIARGIDARHIQHPGIDHAAAENLHPVGAFADAQHAAFTGAADIHFRRRFGEREIARAESHRQIGHLEEGFGEIDQAAFEMAHMSVLIDHQPLDLMEHRRMGDVGIAAIGAARRNDAVGRLTRFHGADLHRRGMRAQQQPRAILALGEIERVVHLPGRMLGRDVEGGEIMEIVLDVRPLSDGKTHIAKYRHHFIEHLADRVDAALSLGANREGNVDFFRAQARIEGATFKRGAARIERIDQFIFDAVERLTSSFARLGIESAEGFHARGQAAFLAERCDARDVERRRIPRFLERYKNFSF